MPTLGEQLKQAREERRLTTKQAAEQTRLRLHYVEALEADDYTIMPSAAQGRGFLRLYVEFLGLNLEQMIALQKETAAPADPIHADSPPPASPEPEPSNLQMELEPGPDEESEALGEPEALPQPREKKLSDAIYLEIGQQIRQRRELLGLTLEEIERHTHIRRNNLTTIEAGHFDQLPSPVQARGMLSGYASFLDMNVEAILLRFADALQARRLEKQPVVPAPAPAANKPARRPPLPAWARRYFTSDAIFIALIIFVVTSISLWGAARLLDDTAVEETVDAPSISEVLLASPEATSPGDNPLPTSVEEIPQESQPEEEIILPTETPGVPAFVASANLTLTLSIRERTFLRVIADGEIVEEGRFAAGSVVVATAAQRIEVLTGSGASVQATLNQADLGILGNPGEVTNIIYTQSGPQTPTPTVSPTPTETPRVTPTLTPSITPTPTPTRIGE